MDFGRTSAAFLTSFILSSCGAQSSPMHGEPEIAAPCVIDEGDLDFHTILTTCMYARERYEVLFGRPAFPVTVAVRDTTAMRGDLKDGRVVLYLASMRALSRARSSFSHDVIAASGGPTALLGHEIGHLLLVADTYDGRTSSPGMYGSFLPDWLDESVAIWAESETERDQRRSQAAALDDMTLDLLSFVTRPHPHIGGPGFQHRTVRTSIVNCHGPDCPPNPLGRDTFRIISKIDTNGFAHVDTVFPEDPGFHIVDTYTYYAIASTILPFFHDRGGPALVNVILDRVRHGRNGADLFAGLPGMPPDPTEVNRQWRAFVKAAAADPARSP